MKSQILIHPEELSKKWIDRMAEAGISVLGLHPVGGVNAVASVDRLLDSLRDKEFLQLLDYAKERGLQIEYELHSAGYLLDRSLFEAHPEYFRMSPEGARVPENNFCVTNEDALELVAKRAAELAQQLYGSDHRFYFWLDDARGLSCCCPSCKGYSASEQQLIVLNRIQREIRRVIPDARLAYLAYLDTICPPIAVKPDEGIFLEYAPFDKYVSAGNADKKHLIEQEAAMIEPLLACFGKQDAKVLEYWFDNSLFSKWEKPPKKFTLKHEQMKADIQRYREKGFEYISSFGCFLGEDYEELHGEVDIRPLTLALNSENA